MSADQLDMFGAYTQTMPERPGMPLQNHKQWSNKNLAQAIVQRLFKHQDAMAKGSHVKDVQEVLDANLTRMWTDVVDFHTKFGLTYDGPPRSLEPELRDFRINFMHEELKEYMDAHYGVGDEYGHFQEYDADPIEQRKAELDALVDLVYVALGTAYLQGFNFAEAWRRVQNANMAKVRVERAEDSKRGSSFDVVKPKGWRAPDHSDLV